MPQALHLTRAELLERVERLTTSKEAAAFLCELIPLIGAGKVRTQDANAATRAVDRKLREWCGR